jgi:hypothetical protein
MTKYNEINVLLVADSQRKASKLYRIPLSLYLSGHHKYNAEQLLFKHCIMSVLVSLW